MDCKLFINESVQIDSNGRRVLVCAVCERGFRASGLDVRRTCVGSPDSQPIAVRRPPLLARLKNFTLAAIAHEMNGAPTCSQEQIDERLALCKVCPLFLPAMEKPEVGVCGHKSCGCNLNSEEKYLNKLAWADQECPDGHWPRLD